MAKKTDVFGVSGTDTVIGSSVTLKGNLNSDTDVTLDGKLAGNIRSGGHVTIGVNAHVIGDIQASSAAVAGKLEGNIKATDSASIMETGHVRGDIDATRLEVSLGAIFIGSSRMKEPKVTEIEESRSLSSNGS